MCVSEGWRGREGGGERETERENGTIGLGEELAHSLRSLNLVLCSARMETQGLLRFPLHLSSRNWMLFFMMNKRIIITQFSWMLQKTEGEGRGQWAKKGWRGNASTGCLSVE